MRKYIGIIFLLLVSCKSDSLIVGLAVNSKDGATIQTDEGVYLIQNKEFWEDSINNRNVQAKIEIKSKTNVSNSDLIDENMNLNKQGRVGITYISELKEIQIIE